MNTLTKFAGIIVGATFVSCLSLALVARADDATSTPAVQNIDAPASDSSTTNANTDAASNTGSNASSALASSTEASTPAPAPDPASSEATSSGPLIVTGDAVSSADTSSKVNTNEMSATSSATSSGEESVTITDENVASTTNTVSAVAQTGNNTAAGGGTAAISTGSAFASANVINVVNTNLIGSEGLFKFLNTFFAGGFDFRNLDLSYFTSSAATSSCSLRSCAGSTFNIFNGNTATVTNDVVVRAATGGNSAASDSAAISTGDAAASANVVNVVNTNLLNSHYLLIALNNFGDLLGDITMPNANFFDKLMSARQAGGALSASNDNTATVTSSSTASADTGSNIAGDIATGNALSNSTTFDQVNTNQVGGSKVFMLVNVFGDWTGNVQGLPKGLTWTRTPHGVAITGDSSGLSDLRDSSIADTNNASVNNNVEVYALTGQNYSASPASSIETGNAYASSNIVNLVNTNIIGENWMLAIMNIFGNWSGDLAFGHPDLWIGGVAHATTPTPPGTKFSYTFTVANHGDADATNVVLHASFDPALLSFAEGSTTSDGADFSLGDLAPGASKDFTFDAKAGEPEIMGLPVPLSAAVSEDQHDENTDDNTENLAITIGVPSSGGTVIGPYQQAPKLTITKTASLSTTTASSSVDFKVVIANDSNAGPAFHATLSDTLFDPSGNDLYDNSWDLDTIAPGDEITLTYTVQFASSSVPGDYADQSDITAFQNYPELPYANNMPVVEATSTVEIIAPAEATSTASTTLPLPCAPLLTSYLFPGSKDAGSVSKLQTFLRDSEHLQVQTTGFYDSQTTQAVKEFQEKYADEILAPWNLAKPSGYVYFTTRSKINELYCPEQSFPLTEGQLRIMHTTKPVRSIYGFAKPPKKFFAQSPAPATAAKAEDPIADMTASVSDASAVKHGWSIGGMLQKILPFFTAPFAQARD